MSFGEPGIGQIASVAAAVCGAGGFVCVVVATPRSGASVAAMFLAFTTLLVGGILGIEGTPVASPAWGGRLAAIGALALFVSALLLLREAGRRDRALEMASGESDAQQLAAERLASANARLEAELRDTRARHAALEHAGAQDEAARTAKEAATPRHRTALDASSPAEHKYRSIFDGAIEGMATLERETLRLVEVNPSLARSTGYTPEELTHRTILDLFAAGPGRPTKADLQRAGRERHPLTVQLARKDGGATQGSLTVTVIGSGAETRLLAVVRDVSARHLADEESLQEILASKERERLLVATIRDLETRNSGVAPGPGTVMMSARPSALTSVTATRAPPGALA